MVRSDAGLEPDQPAVTAGGGGEKPVPKKVLNREHNVGLSGERVLTDLPKMQWLDDDYV